MLNPLYNFVARSIVVIHSGIVHIFGTGGYTWALAIIALTVALRIILVPLFVKQIKSQRAMQVLQPKIKEIREKHKDNKERQQQELMALYKEHGNPLLGCVPLLAQIPLFIALYHVLDGFVPKKAFGPYIPSALDGLKVHTAEQIARAKIFGASLAASLTSPNNLLHYLGSHPTNVRVLAIVLMVLMAVTTYYTQRQIMGSGTTDPSQATQQKVLLYAAPVMLFVFGVKFSLGVLLYWFATNVWSMGQQYVILRRMPPVGALAAAAAAAAAAPTPTTVQGQGRNRRPVIDPSAIQDTAAVTARPRRFLPPAAPTPLAETAAGGGAPPPRPVTPTPVPRDSAPNGPSGARRPPRNSAKRRSRRGGRR